MVDLLEVRVLPVGPRFPAQVRPWVNGQDAVQDAVGDGDSGPLAVDALPAQRPSLLRATSTARRVQLGEPECTGGCCGYLSVLAHRIGAIVQWTDWQVPRMGTRLPEFYFGADEYDVELTRAEADRSWKPLRSPRQLDPLAPGSNTPLRIRVQGPCACCPAMPAMERS